MRQRVMIAIGLACNPKLIIADEPTTALDVTIQAQILELMKDLSRRLGIALIVITHNLGIVARYADRVNVMYAARIVEQGTADDVFLEPRASLHDRPDALGPAARPAARRQARDHRGPAARPARAAARLPLRAALSVPARRLRAQDAAAAPRSRRAIASACIRANGDRRRHAGAAAVARGAAARRRSRRPAEPLLVVDHLKKYFTVKAAGAGFMSSRPRP